MLKKILRVALVLCLYPVVANAKLPYGMAGCGLGSTWIDPDGNQVFASTTNQTFANQAFGITSGTLNCLDPSQAAALNAQQQFINTNYSTLTKEIAQGDGETLRAFSSTFGCSKDVYVSFASQMQKSYGKIFSTPGAMAALSAVEDTIKGNAQLSQSCSLAI